MICERSECFYINRFRPTQGGFIVFHFNCQMIVCCGNKRDSILDVNLPCCLFFFSKTSIIACHVDFWLTSFKTFECLLITTLLTVPSVRACQPGCCHTDFQAVMRTASMFWRVLCTHALSSWSVSPGSGGSGAEICLSCG